jgi:membrane-associated phospholipid phosphatase
MKPVINATLKISKFIREKFSSRNEYLAYYITIVIAFIIFVIALNAFVELTEELKENELAPFDTAVQDYVITFRTPWLTSFFEFMTNMGDRLAYILITMALSAFFYLNHKSWKFILQTASVLILSTISNVTLKQIINRARPSLEHLVTVNTLSYPSGHSMSAMAFYGFLIYLCLRYPFHRALRFITVALLALVIVCIGLSRIYLGVHYPSDVIAGFIGGLIWVTFCAFTFNLVSLMHKRNKAKAARRANPI